LLSLQVDLFHQGKNDEDDHKVVYERLLNLAVPPDPDGKGIKLEDCLEEYFNSQVDVLRDSLEEKKAGERAILSPRNTIRLVSPDDQPEVGSSARLELSPIQMSPTDIQPPIGSIHSGSTPTPTQAPAQEDVVRPTRPNRSTSVIQRIVVGENGTATDSENSTLLQRAVRKGSTVVKAVTIPAWQFFRLIRE
jgi:hypothetical protein